MESTPELWPEYGYFANASKTWLVVKPELLPLASDIFAGSGVNITVEGRRQLGAALGTRSFTEVYVKNKVQEWVGEVVQLSQIASSQPQAAYAALTHGLISKWTYLQRTVDDISDLFKKPSDLIFSLPLQEGQESTTLKEIFLNCLLALEVWVL